MSTTQTQPQQMPMIVVVLVVGASGDLAQTKTYPALFQLWQLQQQSSNNNNNNNNLVLVRIMGFARTVLSDQQLRERLRCVCDCATV